MERRFSEMTPHELTQKIGEFTDKAGRAEQLGRISELAVYERKIDMARAYLMDPETFKPGQVYDVDGRRFTIHYMKGRFAWGMFDTDRQLHAFPISLLKSSV